MILGVVICYASPGRFQMFRPAAVINLVRKLNYSGERSGPDSPGQGNNLRDERHLFNNCGTVVHLNISVCLLVVCNTFI